MLSKKMNKILETRKEAHMEDSFGIAKCWDDMNELLSQNEEQTIAYLRNINEADLYYVGEVFDDISENLQSQRFIEELEKLDKKYPKLDLSTDITMQKKH